MNTEVHNFGTAISVFFEHDTVSAVKGRLGCLVFPADNAFAIATFTEAALIADSHNIRHISEAVTNDATAFMLLAYAAFNNARHLAAHVLTFT